MRVLFILFILCCSIMFTANAWDNPNAKPNVGEEALRIKMIASFMTGFNDGKNNYSKDSNFIDGEDKDFLSFYEEGYYKGRVFWYQKH